MSWGWLSPRGRVLARAGIGVLGWVISPGLVDEAVADGLAWEMRLRGLPARLSVYFTLGLCLFSGLPYGQVLRCLVSGLEGALAAAGWQVPSGTALTAARRRLGERPLESLFGRLCSALSPGTADWSHLGGLLVVAWDGTSLAVPDSPANVAAFGRPGSGGRQEPGALFPQARLVTLVACGTRALLGAAVGPVRGRGSGEAALARGLLGALRPGMLLLADKGFYSYRLWNAAAAAGADLLWRVKSDIRLPVRQPLPDGSWLSVVNGTREAHLRNMRNANRRSRGSRLPQEQGPLPGDVTVRVIEFLITLTCDDGTARTERYRAVTTLLDHRRYPAADLAAAYARRWGIESAYREAKSYLAGGRILRSRTPALARQEAWALLITYQAIRAFICHAAAGTDPGRLSFTAALNAARRTLASPAATLASAGSEILASPLPGRPPRTCARALADPTRPYLARNGKPQPVPQAAHYALTITPPGTTTRHHHDQQQHATSQRTRPP